MIRICLTAFAFAFPFASFAQESKTPWTERIELFGDIRLRHDYTSKSKPTGSSPSHLERLRLRAGFNAKVNEEIKTKVRFATSQGQTPIATNQTLTDNANKKGLYVDLAQIDWAFAEGQSLLMGKIENPLRVLSASQLLFDVDYTPEGGAYGGQFGDFFVKAAGFVIQDRTPQSDGTTKPDSWLMSGLVGYKADVTEKIGLTLAGGYHTFTSIKKNAPLTPGFAGNSRYTDATGSHYLHDYQVGELLGELRLKGESCSISVYFDALNNFYLDKDNRAYLAGTTWQTLDDRGKAVWTFGYAYQSIDKDATVSALNNSDFASGTDGAFGHIFQLSRAVAQNATLSITWNNAHIDNGGAPFESDKAFLDFVVAF